MTVEIENQRGNQVLRAESLLTGTFVESLPAKLNGFDMLELGFSYQAHSLAPVGVKLLFRILSSPDGLRYFEHATSQDIFPGGPGTGINVIRSAVFVREFDFQGKPGILITAWHSIRTAARYIKVAALEQNNAGNFGQLMVVARAADA